MGRDANGGSDRRRDLRAIAARMKANMNWLVKLAVIETMLAAGFMMIGAKPVGVFVIAMAAHSAYLAGQR